MADLDLSRKSARELARLVRTRAVRPLEVLNAHLRVIDDVVATALSEANLSLRDIDVFGATAGPGLIGALLVGLTWGKAAAYALDKPLVAVHHMEAHVFATSLENEGANPPFVALLVSGGHTMLLWVPEWGRYELLGETRDDAAGEAFDKVARFLGLGYPGGPAIDRLARDGDPDAIAFPRAMPGELDFSFSGPKTAVVQHVRAHPLSSGNGMAKLADVAASFQATAVKMLVRKTVRAALRSGVKRIVLTGGVAANTALRQSLEAECRERGFALHVPSRRLCTDNAAMIAAAGHDRLEAGERAPLSLNAIPDLALA